jgi:RNA polymerase sigma-70 factor (ECF subfamily)
VIFGADLDDQLIVAQILGGHKELFRFLLERHQRSVFSMGMGFFHNREDSADFVQEVFIKAFQNLSSFERKARFSTWLYRIAYNTALNGIKRNKEYLSLAENEDLPDFDTPEKNTLKIVTQEAIRELIIELPERFRVCVDLYFFYDRSYQEIEVITGYSINTVKSHVFRAKKILREKLENQGFIEN